MGFLLYKNKRMLSHIKGVIYMSVKNHPEMDTVLKAIQRANEKYKLDTTQLFQNLSEIEESLRYEQSLLYALNQISMADPNWTFLASNLYLNELYQKAAKNRGYLQEDRYGDFYTLLTYLTNIGIYSKDLLNDYTKDEIDSLGAEIDPDKD